MNVTIPQVRFFILQVENQVKIDMGLTKKDFKKNGILKSEIKKKEYMNRIRHKVMNIIRCIKKKELKLFVEDFPEYVSDEEFIDLLKKEGLEDIFGEEDKVVNLMGQEKSTIGYSEFEQFSVSVKSDPIITKLNKFQEESNFSITPETFFTISNYINEQRKLKTDTRRINKHVAQWVLNLAIKFYDNPNIMINYNPGKYYKDVCFYYKNLVESLFKTKNLDISECKNISLYYDFLNEYSDWEDFVNEYNLDLMNNIHRCFLEWIIKTLEGERGQLKNRLASKCGIKQTKLTELKQYYENEGIDIFLEAEIFKKQFAL